jgi:2-(1,2-epoxy-1,2-dihydrophenyl)acetyl-CoA isomerase
MPRPSGGKLMDSYSNLLVDRKSGVVKIILNRPKANAFTTEMIDELIKALIIAEEDDQARCLIITGAGGVFSAGQDVGIIAAKLGKIHFRQHLLRTYNRLIVHMRRLEKPIIGAINGAAAGAGLGVALATDIRIAGDRARFVFGFSGIGLAADSGVSLHLPQLIGLARASQMAFTNEDVSAEQALAWGLVNRVVADRELAEQTDALAERIARGPTRALGLTKRAYNHAVAGLLEQVMDYEAYLQDIAGKTQDHLEGVRAFMEKRPPRFEGK